jgi:hypothetical protein
VIRIPVWATNFSLLQDVQTGSQPIGTGVLSWGEVTVASI